MLPSLEKTEDKDVEALGFDFAALGLAPPNYDEPLQISENDQIWQFMKEGELANLNALLISMSPEALQAANENNCLFYQALDLDPNITQLLLTFPVLRTQVQSEAVELMIAVASKGYTEVLKVLLSYQIFADQVAANKNIVFRVAMQNRQLEIAKLLLNYPKVKALASNYHNVALVTTVERGDLEAVQLLLNIDNVLADLQIDNHAAKLAAQQEALEILDLFDNSGVSLGFMRDFPDVAEKIAQIRKEHFALIRHCADSAHNAGTGFVSTNDTYADLAHNLPQLPKDAQAVIFSNLKFTGPVHSEELDKDMVRKFQKIK